MTLVLTNHLGLGDALTMNGAVRYLATKTDIILVCRKQHLGTLSQVYRDTNVRLYPIDRNHFLTDLNDPIYKKPYQFAFTGAHCDDWGKDGLPFFQKFYQQLGLDYSIRFQYEDIQRDLVKEKEIYDRFVRIYGPNYIFTHDHTNSGHFAPRPLVEIKSDLPVFHPDVDTLGFGYLDNIIDYGMIIENAKEIWIRDSCYSCLLHFLKPTAIRKVLFTSIPRQEMIAYSPTFEGWEFVMD